MIKFALAQDIEAFDVLIKSCEYYILTELRGFTTITTGVDSSRIDCYNRLLNLKFKIIGSGVNMTQGKEIGLSSSNLFCLFDLM